MFALMCIIERKRGKIKSNKKQNIRLEASIALNEEKTENPESFLGVPASVSLLAIQLLGCSV